MENREETIQNRKWLDWAREIQAIGQTGLHFSTNEFDRLRYGRLETIAAEIFSLYSGEPFQLFADQFKHQSGYATPKVDVRAALFQDEKILLVQERSDGLWSLPGGWADVNESPSAMVEREVWEESGYRAKARKLTGVYAANRDRDPVEVFFAYKLVFLCNLVGGQPTPSIETAAAAFFPLDALPDFSPARTHLRYIQEAQAHLADPCRPAAFD